MQLDSDANMWILLAVLTACGLDFDLTETTRYLFLMLSLITNRNIPKYFVCLFVLHIQYALQRQFFYSFIAIAVYQVCIVLFGLMTTRLK